MKIGLLYLNEIKYDDLAWVFVKNNIDAEIIDTGISVDSIDVADGEKVADQLKENNVDIAITMDFCPAVSDACEHCGVQYLAWVYDAPQQALFNRQIANLNTHIFSFDKDQAKELMRMGAADVTHFPLATNIYRNSGLVISESDKYRYECGISFIGNMYVDDFYDHIRERACESTGNLMDEITDSAFGIWDGINHLKGKLSDSAINELAGLCGFTDTPDDRFSMNKEDYLMARLFARKLTYLERVEIAKRLSGYDFRLYTASKNFDMEGVEIWPQLSYDEELPKAYHLSKININLTLHSITSGIPLRVFDIMGVGGFVLSNYQPEIEDYFTPGSDIEVYRSLEELEDKAGYYLSHEDIRTRIAINGYRTVSENFSYDKAFNKMMDHIGVRI